MDTEGGICENKRVSGFKDKCCILKGNHLVIL